MVMNFLCRLFSCRCDPKQGQQAEPSAHADLGQKEAKDEALSEEQLRHMEGRPAAKSTQRKKAKPS
jgi:hypothetical protein